MSDQGLVIDPDEPGGQAPPIQAAVDAGPPVIPVEEPDTSGVAPPDDEDDALEAEAVTVQGGKFAPLAAIKESRKATREAKAVAKAEAERATQLEQQLQQVAGWVQEHKPYIELLRNNPDLLKPRSADPAPPAGAVADPDAEELARTLSLYTPEGQPDLQAAQRVMALADARAEKKVAARVQPLEQRNAVAVAQRNIERLVLDTKDGRGQPIPIEAWQKVLIPFKDKPELLSNPDVLELVRTTAAGVAALNAKAPQVAAPTKPPVFTEASGGVGAGAVPPNPLQATFAKKWGTTPQKVAAMVAKYNPDMPAVLED